MRKWQAQYAVLCTQKMDLNIIFSTFQVFPRLITLPRWLCHISPQQWEPDIASAQVLPTFASERKNIPYIRHRYSKLGNSCEYRKVVGKVLSEVLGWILSTVNEHGA